MAWSYQINHFWPSKLFHSHTLVIQDCHSPLGRSQWWTKVEDFQEEQIVISDSGKCFGVFVIGTTDNLEQNDIGVNILKM